MSRVQLRPAPDAIMDRVKSIEKVCAEYNVRLSAAALQFGVAHPAIPSFIAGTRAVEQLQKNLAWLAHPDRTEFWESLNSKGLPREDAPTQ